MDKAIGAFVAVAIIAVVAWLVLRSWRRRTTRDAALSAHPLPAALGAPSLEAEVLYVATTPAGEPLERLAVPGLAFRGSGRVEVGAEGVALRIAGEPVSFIPADRLIGAATATYAIDRAVEPEGLIAVSWIAALDDAEAEPPRVDSYLRARYPGDQARIIRAIEDIAAAPDAPRPEHESEASDD
ncbi:hypothetical protein MUN74_17420 [Agromyces endophyticus]|uniref:PH-like domain-containing protein n=1 Tax=Agromyces sp. H17E-10 TaxID=2932244 RepID=UPI001FD57F22|nr:hypothetical protein [Agromyces sp. H17E-10]UOQ89019.1 hypothetical protein MUN74_17420 [Agromyces sp. H17E-10]